MINYTELMSSEDFAKVADSIDIDWGQQPGNDTRDPITTAPHTPPPPANNTAGGTAEDLTDVHNTNGFGLHFVGHSFGETRKVGRV